MSPSHAGKRLLVLVAGALTALVMLVPAAQAATPLPGYTQFTGCPTVAQDSSVETCITSVITGGHFKMGSKNVPINKTIALTGGRKGNGDIVWNSEGGLAPVKLEIPGGLIGLTGLDWLINVLNAEQLKVYAVTETVGTPNLDASLKLPIRVHLINPVIGSSCYVGSATNPINLNLITGTTEPPPPNEPITGQEFGFSYDETTNIISLPDAIFVDNSFAAPAAKGCVLNVGIPLNIDAIVNLQSGLPSAAGTNETVQEADAELTPPTTVYGP